jgi:hypothetical protein
MQPIIPQEECMLAHSENALQAVKSLAFQRIPIAVTACHKGLFLEEKVAPLKVGPDFIIFQAPKKPICQVLQNRVILHSQVLPETVRTDLLALDTENSALSLTNFAYTGTYWHDRREQRVEPSVPVKAEITIQDKIFQANLNNLSLHGAGLLVYFGDEDHDSFRPGLPVEVSFQLGTQGDFHISGVIASIRQMDCSLGQMGLQLHPSLSQTSWLENYISERKMEILAELEERQSPIRGAPWQFS